MRNPTGRLALSPFLLLAACVPFSGFVHDEVLVGPYRLNAVDTDEDMAICWATPEADCVGDGLPGPTVFAAGFDENYLVAAVHPSVSGQALDKTVTHYYYVVRAPDEAQKLPYSGINGPFDEASFKLEKARLHLPEFTRTFDNLR